MNDIPPCTWLYAKDRASFLRGIIASLEEELARIPRHRFNAQKVADRERALADYRAALARIGSK